MRCSKCDYKNPSTARFCQYCGAQLIEHLDLSSSGRVEPPDKFRTYPPSPPPQPRPIHRPQPPDEASIMRTNSEDRFYQQRSRPTRKTRGGSFKILAPVVIIVLLLLGVHWFILPLDSDTIDDESSETSKWNPGFDVNSFITSEDRTFYKQYPQSPMLYSITKRTLTQTADIVFDQPAVYGSDLPVFTEQFGRTIALYDWAIQGAQVTPSIENLAQRLRQNVGSDRVEQAKEIFNFVANYLEYSIDGAYEYPITSLLEREGQCSEYATLLTSLYLASGFKTYYVFTEMEAMDYFQMYHIWVAVYLPEYTATDSSQDIITSKLGDGWLGLDTTGNQVDFGELFSSLDYHSNIISIVEPITSMTIYDLKAEWDVQSATEGSSAHLDVYLHTWAAVVGNKVNITFELHKMGEVTDTAVFELEEYDETTLSVDLSYTGRLWKGEGEQYITISVR